MTERDIALVIGLLLLAAALGSLPALYRRLRSGARPRWLVSELAVEHVLLAHMALLLTGAALLLSAVLG